MGYQHRGAEKSLISGPNKRSIHTIETVAGDTSIAFAPAPGGEFLQARVPQAALPATIVVKARFENAQPEYRFDFQFYDYSKDPK